MCRSQLHSAPSISARGKRSMSAVARSGVHSPFQTIPATTGGVHGVAHRSSLWAQMREQRMHHLIHRQQRSEREQCTFQPAVGGAAYPDAVGGNSSLDVVARGVTWQAMRDARLQAARKAQLESASMPARHNTGSQQSPTSGRGKPSSKGEPLFMTATVSASQRSSSMLATGFDDNCCGQLPEWAAPRGGANLISAPSW